MKDSYRLYKGAWIFSADPHKEDFLGVTDAMHLLSKGGFFVRNVYDFDIKDKTSFWYVIKDKFGGYEELSSKMRNQVRKCFTTMEVRQITSDFLLSEGYDVYLQAFENYKIKTIPPTKQEFQTRIQNAEENEFWGVFDTESCQLVAFSMNMVTDESCEYRTMKAIPMYQKKYAYYGLLYEMNRYYLEERGLKYVNDGARSITGHSNIQTFLMDKFNFRKAYCNLTLYYKWWFKIIIYCLYPIRRFIKISQLEALLNMEAMARKQA